jgi:multidrug efflux pump subunit AcrA (membrane-fusion protein)
MNSLEVEVDVNESYITRVRQGQPVNATLDAYPDWIIPGRVRTVIPTADRQKATIKVRISFDQLDPRIIPDMGVKVAFLEERKKEDQAAEPATVFVIPAEAVKDDAGQPVVYVLRDKVVERRAVKVVPQPAGQSSSDALLQAGVAAGDMVVVSSPQPLVDGQAVKVKEGN